MAVTISNIFLSSSFSTPFVYNLPIGRNTSHKRRYGNEYGNYGGIVYMDRVLLNYRIQVEDRI